MSDDLKRNAPITRWSTTSLAHHLKTCSTIATESFRLKPSSSLSNRPLFELNISIPKTFFYRDIKPDNFLIKVDKQRNILYTIDFGLVKEFYDVE